MTGKYLTSHLTSHHAAMPGDWKTYLDTRSTPSGAGVRFEPKTSGRSGYSGKYNQSLFGGASFLPRPRASVATTSRPASSMQEFLDRSHNHSSESSHFIAPKSQYNAWVSSAADMGSSRLAKYSTLTGDHHYRKSNYQNTYSPIRNRLSTHYSPTMCHLDTCYSSSPTMLPPVPCSRFYPSEKRSIRRVSSQNDASRGQAGRVIASLMENNDIEAADFTSNSCGDYQKVKPEAQHETEHGPNIHHQQISHWGQPQWKRPEKVHWRTDKTPDTNNAVKPKEPWEDFKAYKQDAMSSLPSTEANADATSWYKHRSGILSNIRLNPWAEGKVYSAKKNNNSDISQWLKNSNIEDKLELEKQVSEARAKFNDTTATAFNLRTPKVVKRPSSVPLRRKGLTPYKPMFPNTATQKAESPKLHPENTSANCQRISSQNRAGLAVVSPALANDRGTPSGDGFKNKIKSPNRKSSSKTNKGRYMVQIRPITPVKQTGPARKRPLRRRRRKRKPGVSLSASPVAQSVNNQVPPKRRRRRRIHSPVPFGDWGTGLASTPTGLTNRKSGRKRFGRKKPANNALRRGRTKPLAPISTNAGNKVTSSNLETASPQNMKMKRKTSPLLNSGKTNTSVNVSVTGFNPTLIPYRGNSGSVRMKESPTPKRFKKRGGKTSSKANRREGLKPDPWEDLDKARQKLRTLLGAENQDVCSTTSPAMCSFVSGGCSRNLSPGPFGREDSERDNEGGLFPPNIDPKSLEKQTTTAAVAKPKHSDNAGTDVDADYFKVSYSRPKYPAMNEFSYVGKNTSVPYGGVTDSSRMSSAHRLQMFPMIKSHSVRKHQPSINAVKQRAQKKATDQAILESVREEVKPILPTRQVKSAQDVEAKVTTIPVRETKSAPEPQNVQEYTTTKQITSVPQTSSTRRELSLRRVMSARGAFSNPEAPQTGNSSKLPSLPRPKSASTVYNTIKRPDITVPTIKPLDDVPTLVSKPPRSLNALENPKDSSDDIAQRDNEMIKEHLAKAKMATIRSKPTPKLVPESTDTLNANIDLPPDVEAKQARRPKRRVSVKKTYKIPMLTQGSATAARPQAKTYQELGLAPLVRSPSSENTFHFAVNLAEQPAAKGASGTRRKRFNKKTKPIVSLAQG